jgi:hypothetical protein
MTRKMLVAAGLALTLGACTGPPPPQQSDAFQGVFNQSAAAVPANAAITISQPAGFITSENVERYIGFIKDSNEYWGRLVPASLTNTVMLADTDPTYFSGRLLAMLKSHFPSLQRVHDFREAVSTGKKSVILIDMRLKPMEPYGDRTIKVDIDAYFFDSGMNPVSKLSGHGEYKMPLVTMDPGMQRSIDMAVKELDAKIKAHVRVR